MKPATRWADFHIYRLDAGIDLLVAPFERFKNASIRLFVRGRLGDKVSETALLPQVLSRGTRRRPTMAKITQHLERLYGASSSAEAVKMGENHVVVFRMDVVADRFIPGRPANLKSGMEFLFEELTDPARKGKSLRPDYVDQERHNQKRAIEDMMSDRAEYASHRCVEEMCRGEAYAANEMGTLEGLAALTSAGVGERHRELLQHAPMELYVTGRVHPEEVAEMANRIFRIRGRGDIRRVPDTEVDVPVRAPRRITEAMDVEQGKLVMGYRTRTTFADLDVISLSFLNGIFGGFSHSRLFRNVREREGLAYSAGSGLERLKGLLMVHAGIEASKFDKCLAIIEEEMASIQAGKIDDEEMEATRRALSERARAVLDSPSRAIHGLYERRLAGRVQTVDEAVREIEATTKAEVVAVAKKVRLDTVYFLKPKGQGGKESGE